MLTGVLQVLLKSLQIKYGLRKQLTPFGSMGNGWHALPAPQRPASAARERSEGSEAGQLHARGWAAFPFCDLPSLRVLSEL